MLSHAVLAVALAASAAAHYDNHQQRDQLSQVISYKEMRFSECNDFIQTCPPSNPSCASVICKECTDLGQTKLNACCTESADAPAACLQTALRLPNGNDATATAVYAVPTSTAVDAVPTSTSSSDSGDGGGDGDSGNTDSASGITSAPTGAAQTGSGSGGSTSSSKGGAGQVLAWTGGGLGGAILALAMYL